MEAAESLYNGLDSQRCTQWHSQAGFDSSCAHREQRASSECCTRNRCTENSREMRTEGSSAGVGWTLTERGSDFFCVDTQESRRLSCWSSRARRQQSFHASCVAEPRACRGTGIEPVSQGESNDWCYCPAAARMDPRRNNFRIAIQGASLSTGHNDL